MNLQFDTTELEQRLNNFSNLNSLSFEKQIELLEEYGYFNGSKKHLKDIKRYFDEYSCDALQSIESLGLMCLNFGTEFIEFKAYDFIKNNNITEDLTLKEFKNKIFIEIMKESKGRYNPMQVTSRLDKIVKLKKI